MTTGNYSNSIVYFFSQSIGHTWFSNSHHYLSLDTTLLFLLSDFSICFWFHLCPSFPCTPLIRNIPNSTTVILEQNKYCWRKTNDKNYFPIPIQFLIVFYFSARMLRKMYSTEGIKRLSTGAPIWTENPHDFEMFH